jgi:hypothetical protein
MRGRQPALELGWADIAEEPTAGNPHGGVCEGGESGHAPDFPLLGVYRVRGDNSDFALFSA